MKSEEVWINNIIITITISLVRLYRVYDSEHIACKCNLHISHSQREYIALPLGKQYQRAAVAVEWVATHNDKLNVIYNIKNVA